MKRAQQALAWILWYFLGEILHARTASLEWYHGKEEILPVFTLHTRSSDQCSLFKSHLFLQHLHGNINPDMSIYYAVAESWEELPDFIAFLTHRGEEITIPGQGWTWDLREETLYFNIYVQIGFVRKLEKVRVATLLRGKLLPVSIQGGFSSNILSKVNFNTTTALSHKTANYNFQGTPQLKQGNKIYLYFSSSSCQSSVKTYSDLFGNIPSDDCEFLIQKTTCRWLKF